MAIGDVGTRKQSAYFSDAKMMQYSPNPNGYRDIDPNEPNVRSSHLRELLFSKGSSNRPSLYPRHMTRFEGKNQKRWIYCKSQGAWTILMRQSAREGSVYIWVMVIDRDINIIHGKGYLS